MKKEKRMISIIIEVAALFLIGVILTGTLTYASEYQLSDQNVKKQMELHAAEIANETRQAVMEYPTYYWLIKYCYTHSDTMDIEYDAVMSSASKTAEKCRIFSERHPDLNLRYLSDLDCMRLPEEDQKLYAEIAYSWLLTRVNEIKRSYHVDYLFCVISEAPFEKQFFLFSGAEPGAVRGTGYEEAYLLGVTVSVNESQTKAMIEAKQKSNHLADAGKYVDYYSIMCTFDGHSVIIGLTYDLSQLMSDIKTQTLRGSGRAILNQLVLSIICLVLILLFVVRPLKKVQADVRNYKQTKDSDAVTTELSKIRSKNEIGELAGDISEMVSEIVGHMDKLNAITAEKERISTELSLATQIQADMLPNTFPAFPDRCDFDIFASMDPAREVGGDFYDFFLVDDDHLCLVIADVSGKGVPAALFMMASKIILANNAMMGKSPAQILTETNAAICSNNREEMFVTVWLGILELSTGKLTASNAGHEYPIIKKPDGQFEIFKDKHKMAVGGIDGVKYVDYEISLEPGSKLFLYTDGVPEATDADSEMFGMKRLVDALNSDPDSSPRQTLARIRGAVDSFVKDAEQFDDLTMMCVEYMGKHAHPNENTITESEA